ncbi:MAG: fatty acyl-AMP ligase [Myxococcota bacterium]|nr:fatty acyl-AMP ligase [Myxococcota bacterium]
MPHDTLSHALLRAAEVDGLGVSFWTAPGESEHHTYADLATEAKRLAAALRDRGLKDGERVGIILPTGPDFYRAYFGILFAGGVPTALYPPVRLGRVDQWRVRTAKMLTAANCVAVLTDKRLMGLSGEPVRVAGPRLGCHTVTKLVKEAGPRVWLSESFTELATIQFSSGSTGDPKPVALSHDNMLSNARAIISMLPGEPSTHSCVSWLPLYHDMGLVGCMISAMVFKRPLTLLRPEQFVTKPVRWLQALSETRATITVAPNFAFGLTADKVTDEELAELDLSNWRVALCGAEPVHPNTLRRFVHRLEPTGFDARAITPVYGLAEATLAVTFSDLQEEPKWTRFDVQALDNEREARPNNDGRELASLGRPLPGVQVEIRDESGERLRDGLVGSVWMRSPGVMTEYLGRPEATREAIREDRWLVTGDTGFIHEDELYLCGRSKDLVIIRGRNHDPAVFEQALEGIEGVRPGCAAAFAVHNDASDTEDLIVVAELRSAKMTDVASVADAARASVQKLTSIAPAEVVMVSPGTLPRTSSGKIRRHKARQEWQDGELTAPSTINLKLVAKETVRGWLNHVALAVAPRVREEA